MIYYFGIWAGIHNYPRARASSSSYTHTTTPLLSTSTLPRLQLSPSDLVQSPAISPASIHPNSSRAVEQASALESPISFRPSSIFHPSAQPLQNQPLGSHYHHFEHRPPLSESIYSSPSVSSSYRPPYSLSSGPPPSISVWSLICCLFSESALRCVGAGVNAG